MTTLDAVANFAKATLTGTLPAGATSFSVGAGSGALFPNPAITPDYNIVLWNSTDYPRAEDDPDVELLRVTARSTDTFTIARAQEGTSDVDHTLSGKSYRIALVITAKMITDVQTALNLCGELAGNNSWSGTNTFTGIISGDTIQARTSAGLLIESHNGTDVMLLGAGGGSGVTFYGGINAVSATLATYMIVGGSTFNLAGASQISQALGGTLSSTASTEVNISSIGVLSANQQTLTTSAYRISAGSDWTTTAIGMSMNVDTTIRASYVGVSQALWFNPNGGITIGPTPYIGSHSNFTIVGSTSGYSANTVFSSIVNTASSSQLDFFVSNASSGFHPLVAGINLNNLNAFNFTFSGTETMRVTTAGLGIGTSTVNAFLNLAGATTAKASLNITSGAAPATPNNGDIWFDGTDFKARVGGTTKTFTLI